MIKHTPGPWIVETEKTEDGSDLNVVTPDGAYLLATTRGGSCGIESADEAAANARLIAAAPALLEALKLIRDSHAEARGFAPLWWGIMKEAIAKADGK